MNFARGKLALVALGALSLVVLSGADRAAMAAPSVDVRYERNGKSVPCPPIERPRSSTPKGGCVVQAASDDMDASVLSVGEEFFFGNCYLSFKMRVGPQGRVVLEDPGMGGFSPCNDALGCFREDPEHRTSWHGQIRTDEAGKPVLDVDACFDTCLGRFQGRLVMELRRTVDAWTARASDAPVGVSGWKLNGSLELASSQLEVAPRQR